MTREQIIEKAKAYAQENYNKGFDIFVETYDQEEWERFVYCDFDERDMTWEEVKELMKRLVGVWNDRRADAINSAF